MSQESQAYIQQQANGLIGNAIQQGKMRSALQIMASYANRDVLQKSVDAEEADSKTDKERIADAKGHGKTHGVGNDATGTLDTNVDEDDGIEKAEGGRGGTVIGHTTSGKPIYNNYDHYIHKTYDAADHTDAAHAHGKLITDKTSKKQADYHQEQKRQHIAKKQDMSKIQKSYETGARKVETLGKTYDERIGSFSYNRDEFHKAKQPKALVDEKIEKSNSAIDALKYSARVKKTGKEIKEKLTGVKEGIAKIRDTAKTAYEGLKKKIKEEPKADFSSYRAKDLEQHLPEIPKTFEWGQMYPTANNGGLSMQPIDMVYSSDSKAKAEEISQGQFMQEYNRQVYQYCDACCDLCYLDTLNNNLKDEQEVELSIQDLATLGF